MIQINLFISNFKILIKRVCKIAIGIVFFFGAVRGLNFVYNTYHDNDWGRILWHNYYLQEDNIDNLFLGSSHVFCDINPYMLDELNGENNFNLSSSGQNLLGSYYLLKEANASHDISKVYLELYFWASTGLDGDYESSNGLIPNWRNTDFMRFSLNKVNYMISMSKIENYPETFMPFLRFRDQLFDTDYIKKQIEYKSREEYKNYTYWEINDLGEITEYKDKGYYYTTTKLQQKDLLQIEHIIDKEPLTEDAEKYLKKIIEYCKKEDIEITLFCSPIYDLQVIAAGNYDFYVEQIRQITEEYDIEYYDFNLCKEEYLSLGDIKYFMDIHHLNNEGAEKFTSFFWNVMENGEQDCFYDTYKEKLEQNEKTVYGLIYTIDEDAYNYRIVSNRDEDFEYRIEKMQTENEDAFICLQDFSENNEFQIKKREAGMLKIEVRNKGEEEIFQTLEIEYEAY